MYCGGKAKWLSIIELNVDAYRAGDGPASSRYLLSEGDHRPFTAFSNVSRHHPRKHKALNAFGRCLCRGDRQGDEETDSGAHSMIEIK